jgi:hypothetical protein
MIGVGVATIVEIAHYHFFPEIQSEVWAHSPVGVGSVFPLALLLVVVALFVNLKKKKYPAANLPLALIAASLIHVNYLSAMIECCPGG